MSNTVTQTQINGVLEDYKIHLTGSEPGAASTSNASTGQTTQTPSNPANWPSDRRRMPDYRPIEYGRIVEERPGGTILPERIFITIMFTGVAINAVSFLVARPPTVLRLIIETDCCQDLGRDWGPVLSKTVPVQDWGRVVSWRMNLSC